MSYLDRVLENTSETLTIPNPVTMTGAVSISGLVSPLTASRAVVSNGSGVLTAATTTATEIGYVNGVTSAIQTQMNTKSPIASPTFTGLVKLPFQELTASGAITSNVLGLNHATVVIAATLAAPVAGEPLLVVDTSASGTAAHTVRLTAGTFDGTNNTATFDAPNEALYCIGVSATRFQIILNVGSVGLSST
ncbi:MAG: tail fiber protein [Podoviridae sp. cty5g4]|nr:MAG: tail fiber protein [Podoviridae sp. cty5g4]